MTISDRDLADLAFASLLDFHKAKLEGQEFLDVNQVLQKALANESRAKEVKDSQKSNEKSNRPVYVLGCDFNCSDDEGKDVYTGEFVWPSNDKPCICGSLSRFTKIGKKDLLLMYPNAREYLMNYIRIDTSRCRMSYRHLKN